jgi:hypothetical protein
VDVDRGEVLSMRVTIKIILSPTIHTEALNYCIGKPIFIVDNAPWLNRIRGARINIQYRVLSVIEA